MRTVLFALTAVAAAGVVSAESPLGPYNNPEDQWRILSIEGDEHVSELAEIGINMVHDSGSLVMWSLENDAPKPTARKEAERMRRVRDSFQKAGVGYGPYFRYAHDAEGKKLYPRIRRDGQVVNEIDAATPAYLERLARGVAYEAGQVGGDIGGVFVASEMRGRAEPSFTPALTNAYRRVTGREIPPEAVGRNPIPWQQLAGFPKDGVVPDDWPVLEFYRWFWRKGDGWSEALDVTASAYEKACGRRLMTIFDPVLRAPSQWDNLGEGVKQLGNWTYTTPEPYRILYPIAEMQAQTRVRPGLQTHVGVQAIMYRSQSAPLGQHPANEPAWTKEFPNARYITTAPDILEESLWHVFSRQTDGISLHHETSLIDMTPHDDKGYQCTCPEAIRRIGKVFAEVGVPLGPLFRAVPERAPQVAVLESVSAQILGAHITWSPHRYFSETMFIADAANLSPYVLYEDEVKRDGIPASVKTLVLPKCDVLMRTTYEKIRAFQARGGRLVADKMLLPALKADAAYVTVEDEERNTHGDFDNDSHGKYLDSADRQASVQAAAKKLKAAVAVDLYADSDKVDLLVHARSYGTADYVFAVNDRRTAGDYIGPWRRVLEKGLPNAGVVTVRRTAGAVYDLVRHAVVPFSVRNGMTEIPVSFATNDGRVFLVVEKPLGDLSVKVEGTVVTVTSPDVDVLVPVKVSGIGAKPWYAVVKNGTWSRDFGSAAKGAKVSVTSLATGK